MSRLPGPALDRVMKGGRRVAQSSLVLITAAVSDQPASPSRPCRLGIVVGRRVARNAVPRNRIRRILRESFKIQARQFLRRPLDCVLLARPSAASLKSRQDADAIIGKLLMKL